MSSDQPKGTEEEIKYVEDQHQVLASNKDNANISSEQTYQKSFSCVVMVEKSENNQKNKKNEKQNHNFFDVKNLSRKEGQKQSSIEKHQVQSQQQKSAPTKNIIQNDKELQQPDINNKEAGDQLRQSSHQKDQACQPPQQLQRSNYASKTQFLNQYIDIDQEIKYEERILGQQYIELARNWFGIKDIKESCITDERFQQLKSIKSQDYSKQVRQNIQEQQIKKIKSELINNSENSPQQQRQCDFQQSDLISQDNSLVLENDNQRQCAKSLRVPVEDSVISSLLYILKGMQMELNQMNKILDNSTQQSLKKNKRKKQRITKGYDQQGAISNIPLLPPQQIVFPLNFSHCHPLIPEYFDLVQSQIQLLEILDSLEDSSDNDQSKYQSQIQEIVSTSCDNSQILQDNQLIIQESIQSVSDQYFDHDLILPNKDEITQPLNYSSIANANTSTAMYSIDSLSEQKQDCQISLDKIQPHQSLQVTVCMHPFHIKCIDQHMEYRQRKNRSGNCPSCRKELNNTSFRLRKGREYYLAKNLSTSRIDIQDKNNNSVCSLNNENILDGIQEQEQYPGNQSESQAQDLQTSVYTIQQSSMETITSWGTVNSDEENDLKKRMDQLD